MLAVAFGGPGFGGPGFWGPAPASAGEPGQAVAEPASEETEASDAAASDTEAPELGEEWVRVAYDEQGEPRAMQVAIVRYRGTHEGTPVTVDLVGAVHVGDTAYYEKLNARFTQYQALLYELVAPEGTRVVPQDGGENRSVIHSVQNGMKAMLELEHQLEKVDYTRPNFVHADMSPQQFMKSMQDRDEGFLQMYFRMVGQGMAVQSKQQADGQSTDFDIFKALLAPDRARRLKIVFAEQMINMESLIGGFGGEKGSTIITERNKTALGVLREQLAEGKTLVGVFYGAGHLSDMDKRLRKDFSLLPEEITWLDAWDLTK
ncbi:MAG: hypothetical protein AAF790_02405 [Planctomycetota bacterium]